MNQSDDDINLENFNNTSNRDGNIYTQSPHVIPWQNIGLSVISRLDTMDKKIDGFIRDTDSFMKTTDDEIKTFNKDMAVVKSVLKYVVIILGFVITTVVGYGVFVMQKQYSEDVNKAKLYDDIIHNKNNRNKKPQIPKYPKDNTMSIYYRLDNREKELIINKEFA